MKIPVTNNGKHPRYFGGVCILPTETKFIDEHLVPVSERPGAAVQQQTKTDDPVLSILDGSIPDVTAALPTLSDEDYNKLKAAEEAGNKPRVGLTKAFAEEDIRRANANVDQSTETDTGDTDGTDNPGTDAGEAAAENSTDSETAS